MGIGVISQESRSSTRLRWSELSTLACQAVIQGELLSFLHLQGLVAKVFHLLLGSFQKSQQWLV